MDADERVTPELEASIARATASPGEAVAFRVRRRDFLDGRWLRFSQSSPYYLRLFRPERMRYERLVWSAPNETSHPKLETPAS